MIIDSGIVVLKPTNESADYTTVRIARDLVVIAANKCFHVLLKNLSKTPVLIPNGIVVAHLTRSSVNAIEIDAVLLETGAKLKGAVHYKLSIDRATYSARRKSLEPKYDQKVKPRWKSKVKLSDNYAK